MGITKIAMMMLAFVLVTTLGAPCSLAADAGSKSTSTDTKIDLKPTRSDNELPGPRQTGTKLDSNPPGPTKTIEQQDPQHKVKPNTGN